MSRAAALALGLLLAAPGVAGAQALPVCAAGVREDATRPLPAALVPRFRQVFGLPDLPAEVAQRGAVIRCADGRLLACNTGANLPCGKADGRRSIAEADAWCRQGGRGSVPAYVVGHATLFAWECRGGRAEPVRQVLHADATGFVAAFWRALD